MRLPLIDQPSSKNMSSKPWEGEVFVFPTTVGQKGFWYLDQLDPGNPAYNIAVRFRLEGPLDYDSLVRAFNEIVKRHESLRTVIADNDGDPVQVITPSLAITVPIADLRGLSPLERDSRCQVLTKEEARRRFEIAAGPLIRVSLIRLDEEVHHLLVTVHHIIADGWSIGVITQEFGTLYECFCRGLGSTLGDLPIQFGDFSVWEKNRLEQSDFNTQISYWTSKLANLPLLEIPTDHPRPQFRTTNGSIESILLPTALTESLKGLSSREGVTFFMTALAALKTLLSRRTGAQDIFVGTLVAGRSQVELEPLIGIFINPLVLRTQFSADVTFLELLGLVREAVVEALANQDLPFERVVGAVQTKRDPSRHPLFQINFIYQRDFVKPVSTSGLSLTAIPSKSPGAIYDLNFFMVERSDGWRASCEYNTDLYEAGTILRLLSQFQALMESIVADPTRRISQLSMLTDDDRRVRMPASSVKSRVAHGDLSHPDWMNNTTFVKPRNETESRLVTMFLEVLASKQISVTADFFDEGGHSLLAARVLVKIERAFGKKLSLATFLQKPTVEGLATILGDDDWEVRHDQVLAIQPNGSLTPLFLVDAGSFFRPLARELGNNQLVFSLMLPELSQLPDQFGIKDIVNYLLIGLRQARPHGPYLLGGWSHAGVLAHELAQRLLAEGEEVTQVILFDTCSPQYLRSFKGLKSLPIRLYVLGHRLRYHFGNLRTLKGRESLAYMRDRIETIRDSLRLRYWNFWYRRLKQPAAEHLRFSSTFQYLAVLDHEPKACSAPLVLFRSSVLQTGRFRDPTLGWGRIAGDELTVHVLPGNHAAMFMVPMVQDLAKKLAKCLKEGDATVHSTLRKVD